MSVLGGLYPKPVTQAVADALGEKGLSPEDVIEWDAKEEEDGSWSARVKLKPRPPVNIEFEVVKED